MATSNTFECFTECIGKQVVGVLHNAIQHDNTRDYRTLVFDDGTGLTFCSTGAYWRESEKEITQAVKRAKQKLSQLQKETRGILKLAGTL